MVLLDKIKGALRVSLSITAFDDEITDLIAAAKADLQLSGVHPDKLLDTDPLIIRAVSSYVKANFGWDNPDADKYAAAYTAIKMHLTLTAEYTEAGIET